MKLVNQMQLISNLCKRCLPESQHRTSPQLQTLFGHNTVLSLFLPVCLKVKLLKNYRKSAKKFYEIR